MIKMYIFIRFFITKTTNMKNFNLIMGLALCLMATSCVNDNSKSKVNKDLEVESDFANDLNKAKQVFYALPSPIETAYLIKSTGVPYNIDLANSVSNVDNYATTMQKALNFGVYGADLSYTSLFNQTQTTIQYMSATKKLADELGILDFVKADIVTRIENNINDRDSLMEIITDGFVGASEYLKEAGRAEVAALIMAGGWLEGLYISTSLTDLAENNNRLIDLVIDQRLSLSILIKLLDNYKSDENVATVYGWLTDLQNTYNRIKTMSSEIKAETAKDSKTTTLTSRTDPFINDVLFKAICQKADSIRTIMVK